MDQSAGNTGDEESVIDLQFNGMLELLTARGKHVVEALGLGHGTGETVKDESIFISTCFILAAISTYPFLHSALVSSSFLIMLTMISSLTKPPWSMIFFASLPNGVFLATWDRSMSPVAFRKSN